MPFIFVVVEFGNNNLVNPFLIAMIIIIKVLGAIGA
jgi:hypothetical protein